MTGNTGNTGNSGNTGNTGNTGNAGIVGDFGGGWLTSYRVDLPFVTEIEPAGPNELGTLRRANLLMTQFPDRYWGARWNAYRVLHEFTESGWRPPTQLFMDGLW